MKISIACICGILSLGVASASAPSTLVDPFPTQPSPLPVNSQTMDSSEDFPEYQLDIDMAEGPFKANWESIEKNYPGTPDWLRDAKFGIWVHFGPQAAGESGDWYARNLYKEDHKAYSNHIKKYGHPSKVGYKDVLHTLGDLIAWIRHTLLTFIAEPVRVS